MKELNWADFDHANDRSTFIGASEIKAIMGQCRFTNMDAAALGITGPELKLLRKQGKAEPLVPNIKMKLGIHMESFVVDNEWAPRYLVGGESYISPVGAYEDGFIPSWVVQHRDHPFLCCSPDVLVLENDQVVRGCEIKTTYAKSQGWFKSGYKHQVQYTMAITGIEEWELFGAFLRHDPVSELDKRHKHYLFEADPFLQAEMIEAATQFWSYVQEGRETLPEGWGK